jgi:hypothetical protein
MSWLRPLEPVSFRIFEPKKPQGRKIGSGRPKIVPESDKLKIRRIIQSLVGKPRMDKCRELAKKFGVTPRTIQKYGEDR